MIQVLTGIALVGSALGTIALLAKLVLGIYRAAKRIENTFELVNHELKPNGSSSLRDAIDRIEGKADIAVAQAQEAATQAGHAAMNAATALDRIERFEQNKPSATAIVVNPQPSET